MLLLSAVLIAAVSNLDNLGVGFAFGMRDTRVAIAPNLLIAALTMAGTAGAMTSGRALSHLMSPSLATDAGALIIIAIGLATAMSSLRTLRRAGCAAVGRHSLSGAPGISSNSVSWREALPIGVALSLNNVGAGVGAGIAGVSPPLTTLLAGAFSFICLGGGSRVGWSAGRSVFGRWAQLVAGVVLVGVGIATPLGAA